MKFTSTNSIARMDLAEEIEIFRREIADVLAAVEIGDLRAVGLIHRSHVSMSFTRLRRSKERAETSQQQSVSG